MPDLFDKLTKISSEELTRNVSNVDDFSESDREISDLTKKDDYKLGRNLKRIRVTASWSVAIVLGATILVFTISFIYLFHLYIFDIAKDISNVKELLKSWLDYILLVMATLFVQNVFGKK